MFPTELAQPIAILSAGVLPSADVMRLFLSLALLLGVARLLGEGARLLRMPAVVGEIAAGVVLGKTLLGAVRPDLFRFAFEGGMTPVALETVRTVSVALLLVVAGLEVDLSTVFRQGRTALLVGLGGMLFPFALGFAAAMSLKQEWLGAGAAAEPLAFATFFGTALCISALPVISKILMDLRLHRSDLGMVIMSAAMFNDLAGWIVFSMVLGLIRGHGADVAADAPHGSVASTVILTLLVVVFVVTLGRWLVHRSLPWIQSRLQWPGGVLAFTFMLAFLGAATTEAIGIHAIFGAFLAGIMVGDSTHLSERTRDVIHQFVLNVFAPLFFATVALRLNFFRSFDAELVFAVFAIACVGKVVGCTVAGRMAGMPKREAWAVGFGLNARGAMEIILGIIAKEAGLIDDRMFVALVVMALGTSVLSGVMIEWVLKRKKPFQLVSAIGPRQFIPALRAATARDAIAELAALVAERVGRPAPEIVEAAWQREQLLSTALGDSVAVPHARLKGARMPCMAVGLSRDGIDFDAMDGKPARIVFLLVTEERDAGAQLDMLSAISGAMKDDRSRAIAVGAKTHSEFLAALNMSEAQRHTHEGSRSGEVPARA